MSLAERTREAVRSRPFLVAALQSGVLNHAAAARQLDLQGDPEAIATALRRYGESLAGPTEPDRSVTVRMQTGVGTGAAADDALLAVGDVSIGSPGEQTAILVTGEVDPLTLGVVLDRLATAEIDPVAAAASSDSLIVVVANREGATALRSVEAAVESLSPPRPTVSKDG
jgi:hypothetical protein